jgi:hypothetical protein
MTSNDYAPPHAALLHIRWSFILASAPFIEPDVRFSRIRLSDDLSP